MTPADRLTAADRIQNQALHLVRRAHPSTIAAYVPVGTEPGGPDLPRLLAAHARVLLPVLLPDGDLDWAVYAGELAPGPRGLLEPPGPRLGVSSVGSAELVLVPALAVDRRGIRLGRGGGSYDRVLSRLAAVHRPPVLLENGPAGRGDVPSSRIVALLHEGEIVDAVPAEPHDRPVDGVLTPSGLITLNKDAEWTK
jgi:5-formyltetrahydrofolate cyclo-ligase